MYGDGAVSSPLKLETKAGFKEVKNFGVVTTDEEAEGLVSSRQECSGGLQITCRGYIPRCGLIATSGLGFINYIEVGNFSWIIVFYDLFLSHRSR